MSRPGARDGDHYRLGVLPPGLSMLWESVDPALTLRRRFGFTGLDAVTGWLTAALREVWRITVHGCPRMVISDQNAIVWADTDRGRLVVKWSRAGERFARLEASTRLLRTLAASGVPVAAPVATSDDRDRVVLDGPAGPLSVAVLPHLAGGWLDVTDRAAVHAAGACLARVHLALGACHPEGFARAGALTARVGNWLADGDRGFAPTASRRLADLLAAAPSPGDEPQLVHNDFRAANVLVRGSRVVGVLDLDDVVVEHRVHDLAKAGTYLGTRFTNWGPTPAATRRWLRAGYESVRPLDPAEAHWYEVLDLWHGLLAVPGPDDPAGWAAAL
ncbi:phosphotransferase enzyme family protein [Kineococcus sp. SYSU DK003]|uniref:phosphotransferase enzyme family protein n=1 Tax=Kineococcus sp. SYSU DK003 TaxID=3383124 RepID=UPI003D7CEA7E